MELVGKSLGPWNIVRAIGEGSFGCVFEATHRITSKRAAVKVLKVGVLSSDEEQAFLREARALGALSHENIVQIFDADITRDGTFYLATEFLEGTTLSRALNERRSMPALRVARIGAQIARALQAAHAQGMVHRDVKPDNVFLVRRDDGADFVKLLDFGIAKVTDGGKGTRAGVIKGTFLYIPPESWRCLDIDGRADIYSLGVILYQLLSGTRPFAAGGGDWQGWAMQHLSVIPPDPTGFGAPRPLADLVLRMLAKAREERPQSMAEVAATLEVYASGSCHVPKASATAATLVETIEHGTKEVTPAQILASSIAPTPAPRPTSTRRIHPGPAKGETTPTPTPYVAADVRIDPSVVGRRVRGGIAVGTIASACVAFLMYAYWWPGNPSAPMPAPNHPVADAGVIAAPQDATPDPAEEERAVEPPPPPDMARLKTPPRPRDIRERSKDLDPFCKMISPKRPHGYGFRVGTTEEARRAAALEARCEPNGTLSACCP